MKRLIIFDLDGTLLNTIEDLGVACNHALQLHGYPEHPLSDYPHLVGNGVNRLIQRALPEGHKDEETVLALKADFIPFYNGHNRVHTHPYEGMPEVVRELKAKGIRLAVASNKYQEATAALILHYFGADTFDIVLGERAGKPRKPDPQIVSDILADTICSGSSEDSTSHAITPEETLYVGDSDVDMQTASNAGLESVAVTWGFCSREALLACHPDHLIDNARQLLSLV